LRKGEKYYEAFDKCFEESLHGGDLWNRIIATQEAVNEKYKDQEFPERLDKMIDSAEFITDGLRKRALELEGGKGDKSEAYQEYQAMEKYQSMLKSMRAQQFVHSKYTDSMLEEKLKEIENAFNYKVDKKSKLHKATRNLLSDGIFGSKIKSAKKIPKSRKKVWDITRHGVKQGIEHLSQTGKVNRFTKKWVPGGRLLRNWGTKGFGPDQEAVGMLKEPTIFSKSGAQWEVGSDGQVWASNLSFNRGSVVGRKWYAKGVGLFKWKRVARKDLKENVKNFVDFAINEQGKGTRDKPFDIKYKGGDGLSDVATQCILEIKQRAIKEGKTYYARHKGKLIEITPKAELSEKEKDWLKSHAKRYPSRKNFLGKTVTGNKAWKCISGGKQDSFSDWADEEVKNMVTEAKNDDARFTEIQEVIASPKAKAAIDAKVAARKTEVKPSEPKVGASIKTRPRG